MLLLLSKTYIHTEIKGTTTIRNCNIDIRYIERNCDNLYLTHIQKYMKIHKSQYCKCSLFASVNVIVDDSFFFLKHEDDECVKKK